MLYMLFDMAVNSAYDLLVLKKYYEQHRSLFKGTKDEVLEDVGPWLFAVDGRVQEILTNETGLTNPYTVLLESAEGFEAVFGHLGQFVYQTIEGREFFFRFWDSRVLAKFLPTCEPAQLKEFFGSIDGFIAEGSNHGETIVFSQERGRLRADAMSMEEILNSSKV